MLLAVAVLTYMIFWMRAQASSIAGELRANVDRAIHGRHTWGLTILAFVAVFREGAESVLFLGTTALTSLDVLVGGLLGIGVTVGLAYLLFATARRLDLHRFFTVTGVLLIVFAAGLFAQGLHEFQEAGVLPAFLEHLWDTSTILPEDGPLGPLLKGLVGYSVSPSLPMVTGYVGYWAVVASAYLAWKPSRPAEGSAKPKRL